MSIESQNGEAREITLEQLQEVLDFCPVPTAVLQWGKLRYINSSGRTLLGGKEAEQVFYRHILGWSDPEEREELRRERTTALKDSCDQVSIVQKSWTKSDGKWMRRVGKKITVEVKAWTIPLAGGDGTQITFTDITALKQAEEKKLEANQYLALAIESAEVGVWDFDPSTGKILWSKRCCEIFCLPWGGEIDYSTFLKMLYPEDRARTDAAVQESLDPNGGGAFGCDYRILCPDGTVRWIAAKGHAFFSGAACPPKATRMVGTILDITNLRQTDASLRQTEKLAATGRLAASLAHEINNPLEAITNLLYLLRESPLPPEQHGYVERAQQELGRVTSIASQTLRFYHDPAPPVRCNLVDILDSVLTLFGNRIVGSRIGIERRMCEQIFVLGGPEELRQLFVNLVHNSLDAMPHGGRLIVRLQKTTKHPTQRPGVRITVADTGHGMDRATRKRIFEPFFTTRTSVGTGLGLWLCAGIVQKHGGSIRVKSCRKPECSGTVISVFLPFDRRQ